MSRATRSLAPPGSRRRPPGIRRPRPGRAPSRAGPAAHPRRTRTVGVRIQKIGGHALEQGVRPAQAFTGSGGRARRPSTPIQATNRAPQTEIAPSAAPPGSTRGSTSRQSRMMGESCTAAHGHLGPFAEARGAGLGDHQGQPGAGREPGRETEERPGSQGASMRSGTRPAPDRICSMSRRHSFISRLGQVAVQTLGQKTLAVAVHGMGRDRQDGRAAVGRTGSARMSRAVSSRRARATGCP